MTRKVDVVTAVGMINAGFSSNKAAELVGVSPGTLRARLRQNTVTGVDGKLRILYDHGAMPGTKTKT